MSKNGHKGKRIGKKAVFPKKKSTGGKRGPTGPKRSGKK